MNWNFFKKSYLNKSRIDDEENIDVLELLFEVLWLLAAWLLLDAVDWPELLLEVLPDEAAVAAGPGVLKLLLKSFWLASFEVVVGVPGAEMFVGVFGCDAMLDETFWEIVENAEAAKLALAWAFEAIDELAFLYWLK